MKIVVFGASGNVGSIVVAQLLESGHQVTAFMHSSKNATEHANLRIVMGDIYDSSQVEAAITGADAVVSALGSWGTPKKDILTTAMTYIIPAMKKHKVPRIVSLTGAEARASGDSITVFHRLNHVMLNIVAGKVLSDGESHIALLEQSNLSWTVVRSPIMTAKPSELFRLDDQRPKVWNLISRHAVASAMVALAISNDHERQSPYTWSKM